MDSMQIEHEQVQEAKAGQAVGIKVKDRCVTATTSSRSPRRRLLLFLFVFPSKRTAFSISSGVSPSRISSGDSPRRGRRVIAIPARSTTPVERMAAGPANRRSAAQVRELVDRLVGQTQRVLRPTVRLLPITGCSQTRRRLRLRVGDGFLLSSVTSLLLFRAFFSASAFGRHCPLSGGVDLLHQIGHLDGRHHGVETLVAGAAARSLRPPAAACRR